MFVNADFSQGAVVAPSQYQWVRSPQPGIERMLLDRLGGENARATSLVRYAPAAQFPAHAHPGGEEILVLSGTFSEEDGDYPAGWYLRNPPGSSHQPSSQEGAVIFVKLWQMNAHEQQRVRIDTHNPANWQGRDGREVCPLFSNGHEQVSLQRLARGEVLFNEALEGAELLVLSGELLADGQVYPSGSWMRLPRATAAVLVAGAPGVTLYLKTGHLAALGVSP